MTEALEMLEYSYETIKPGQNREKATCPVCGAKYKWRPRGVGWGVLGGENTCSYKCQKEAVRRMEEEQKTMTKGGFNKVSAFDGHLDEIKARIAAGDTMAEIARGYDRSSVALTDWLQKQIGEEALDALKAEGRAARNAGSDLSVSSEDSSPKKRVEGKRLVFETVETEENPECSVVCAESTEAAWRALGVIEGICKTQLLEDYLPPIMAAMETIAEALRG